MKIQLWSVGKSHESYVKAGIEDFTRRIIKYYPIEWKILSPAKQVINTTENDIKKQEAQNVLNNLAKEDFLVLLDEKGKQITSPQLAAFIAQRANERTRQLIFLIGGAFGVDELISKRANYIWSLSQLVFPHQLVRLILAEQVYRACSIIRNEKYHHS